MFLFSLISILTVAATVAILLYWLLQWIRNRKRDPLQLMPWSLPQQMNCISGHAALWQDMNGLGQMFVDGANSDGISKTSLFGETVLGVLRAEHVQAVLNASSYVVQIPIFQKHFEMFLGRRSLLSLMGDEWRVVRKYMARAFNREYLKEMVGDVCHVTNAFLKALEGRHGQVLDFWPLLKCITLDVIGQTGFGYDFNCAGALTPSPVALAFEFMLEELTARPNSPVDPRLYFYSWPSARNRKHASCNATVRDTLKALIARRKQERLDPALVGEEHRDMLKYMLDAHEEDDVSVAADTETLVDNLLTILFAGYDTSSITLTYALYMMSQHSDVEARVLAEVLAVLGPDGQPSYEDITDKLPYCTAVIQEVLRLYPPAPATMRTMQSPLTLPLGPDGRSLCVPAGVSVVIPIWWVHRATANYPDRPETFDPDRFFDRERAAKVHRFAHVAFSGGPRDCVGKRFAILETVGVFALIMRRFRFESISGYALETELMSIVQKPTHGMPLKAFVR